MGKLVIILLLIGYLYHMSFVDLKEIDMLIIGQTLLMEKFILAGDFHGTKNFFLKHTKDGAIKPSEDLNSFRSK